MRSLALATLLLATACASVPEARGSITTEGEGWTVVYHPQDGRCTREYRAAAPTLFQRIQADWACEDLEKEFG